MALEPSARFNPIRRQNFLRAPFLQHCALRKEKDEGQKYPPLLPISIMNAPSTAAGLIRSGLERAFRSNSAWAMIGNFSQQGLSFIIFALLAKYLDPKEVGLLGVCYLFTQGARAIVLDPISVPYLRQADATEEDASWSFTILTVVGASVTTLILIAAPLIASIFRTPNLISVLRAMSLVICIHAMTRIYETRLIRIGDYRLLTIRSIMAVISGGVAAGFLAAIHAGVWILVGQQLVFEAVMLAVVVAKEREKWIPRFFWNAARFWSTFKEAAKLVSGAAAGFLAANTDTGLISFYYGPTALGYYSFTKRILSAIYLVGGSSISSVALTEFIKEQKNSKSISRILLRNSRICFALLTTSYLTLTFVRGDLVASIFGQKWTPSLVYFSPLMFAGLFQLVWLQFSNIGIATGYLSLVSRTSVFHLICFVASALVLMRVTELGPVSIAYALLVSTILSAMMIGYFVGRRADIQLNDIWLAPIPCVATASIAFLIFPRLTDFIPKPGYLVIFLAAVIFLVLILTVLLIDRLIFMRFARLLT